MCILITVTPLASAGELDAGEFEVLMDVMRRKHPTGNQVRDVSLLGTPLGRLSASGLTRNLFESHGTGCAVACVGVWVGGCVHACCYSLCLLLSCRCNKTLQRRLHGICAQSTGALHGKLGNDGWHLSPSPALQYAVREREFARSDYDGSADGKLSPYEFAMYLLSFAPKGSQEEFMSRAKALKISGSSDDVITKEDFFTFAELLLRLDDLQV